MSTHTEAKAAADMLDEVQGTAPHQRQPVMDWAREGYPAQEMAEGVLSNTTIGEPDADEPPGMREHLLGAGFVLLERL